MAGFSLLPYLTKQSDPFSAVLAGKMQAQKQRADTVKWLANYQMQLQRMQMSKAAAGRAQQMHDARMKALRGSTGARTTGGIGLGGVAAPAAQGQLPTNPYAFGVRPGDIIGQRGMFGVTGPLPAPTEDRFNSLGGFGLPQVAAPGVSARPAANPFAYPAAPVAPQAPAQPMQPFGNPMGDNFGSDTSFTSPGKIQTGELDAGTDMKLAALDEEPYGEKDEDENPFSAFA